MSRHSPTGERYHSIDIRPSNDSEEAKSPPDVQPMPLSDDPYAANASLTDPSRYPPRAHAQFGNSATSVANRFLSPSSAGSGPDEKARQYKRMDDEKRGGYSSGASPNLSRNSSYDILSAGETFDTRNATAANLTFAEGDFVQSRAGRVYAYLLNLSIVTRWMLYIIPVAALLEIPGIIGLTVARGAQVWHVGLLWWSIWMTEMWVGWWVALAFSMILPGAFRWTIGVAAVSSRHFIGWIENLERPIALFAWSLASWISFQPLIYNRIASNDTSKGALHLILQILFGIMLCAATLLGEKFAIQWIAYSFHESSYADRITEQKIRVNTLVVLYSHSSNIPGRNDTLKDDKDASKISVNPKKIIQNVLKGVRGVAEGATTAFGNVASEIIGASTLQPSSPEAKVYTALSSANKSRLLARRLFYSFRQEGASALVLGDIARFFRNLDEAMIAFSMFDKDQNGDASREEIELACLDVHRELLSLSSSMRDIDSAVGRLDNVLMSLYFVVALLIMAVSLDASFTNVLTGAGTLILGLSWLIGGSAAEVLTSIIFLFIKHPYDIGDTVEINKLVYTVKEMRLLSTIFIDSGGVSVQAPHSALTTSFILNHRRSGPETEPFEFDVTYDTSFEKIEQLRAKMLAFVDSQRRDFVTAFDVSVKDISDQEKMTLSAVIKYKSNNHLATLKAKRRNMWVCALKNSLQEVGIYGPSGGPKPPVGPSQVTLVPWDEAKPNDKPESKPKTMTTRIQEPRIPRTDYDLTDRNATLKDNEDAVFGEAEEMNLVAPVQGLKVTRPSRPTVVVPPSSTSTRARPTRSNTGPSEEYEMRPGGSAAPV